MAWKYSEGPCWMTAEARSKAQQAGGTKWIEKMDLGHKKETSSWKLHKISCDAESLCVPWQSVYRSHRHEPEVRWMRTSRYCFGMGDNVGKDHILDAKNAEKYDGNVDGILGMAIEWIPKATRKEMRSVFDGLTEWL